MYDERDDDSSRFGAISPAAIRSSKVSTIA
jgi:hypothetical protein